MNDQFDYDAYKKHFFAMLKTPTVIRCMLFVLVGIGVAFCSYFFANSTTRLLVCFAGCAITLASSNRITTFIRDSNTKPPEDSGN